MPTKRIASKKAGHRLREKADAARQYWLYGGPNNVEFDDDDEEYRCWTLVRSQLLEWFPVGAVDKWGYVQLGPHGWWCWDAPGAVKFVEIPGLPDGDAGRYSKLLALKEWGIVAADVRDETLVKRAAEIDRYCRTDHYPFPSGVSPEAKAAHWQALRAEQAAWQSLGYIEEDTDGSDA